MHLMLDLETLGTSAGSAIRSVGAAAFELYGRGTGETFYRNVDHMSCWVAGLRAEPATVAWWKKQSGEARAKLVEDQRQLRDVVSDFNAWVQNLRPEAVWCHGAGFDTTIWEAAARAVGSPVPWKFWTVRCTRTLFDIAGFDFKAQPRDDKNVAHSALDDAVHQAHCVQAAYRSIMKRDQPLATDAASH